MIRCRDHLATVLAGASYGWLFVCVVLSLPGPWLDRLAEKLRRTSMTDKRDDGGPGDIVGHKTIRDGPLGFRHEPLTRAEADALWAAARQTEQRRAESMPDEKSAINAMFDAWLRLKEFGWSDAIYCPKDGSSFQVIEAGSTGIHRAHYSGAWPDGTWWIEDEGDLSPSRPVLYRLYPEDEVKRRVKMNEATAMLAERSKP